METLTALEHEINRKPHEQERPPPGRNLPQVQNPRRKTRGLGRHDADTRGGRVHQGPHHRPGKARYPWQGKARADAGGNARADPRAYRLSPRAARVTSGCALIDALAMLFPVRSPTAASRRWSRHVQ